MSFSVYNIINEFCQKNNIKIEENQIKNFELLCERLKEFNSHTNVTALCTDEAIASRHFCDSIAPLAFDLIPENASVIDVGCGAGFPGIPLKLMRNDISLSLLDSTEKKLKFAKIASDALSFDVDVYPSRAEELAKGALRESFDVAVSRAVASLPVLLELCLGFVRENGILICYKSFKECDEKNPESELSKSKNALNLLGAKILSVKTIYIPSGDKEEQLHALLTVKKVKKCSTIYPRRYAQILKKPL